MMERCTQSQSSKACAVSPTGSRSRDAFFFFEHCERRRRRLAPESSSPPRPGCVSAPACSGTWLLLSAHFARKGPQASVGDAGANRRLGCGRQTAEGWSLGGGSRVGLDWRTIMYIHTMSGQFTPYHGHLMYVQYHPSIHPALHAPLCAGSHPGRHRARRKLSSAGGAGKEKVPAGDGDRLPVMGGYGSSLEQGKHRGCPGEERGKGSPCSILHFLASRLPLSDAFFSWY